MVTGCRRLRVLHIGMKGASLAAKAGRGGEGPDPM
jgi:hypothetical protein